MECEGIEKPFTLKLSKATVMEQMLKAEYECRTCGKAVSVEQYERDRFCPSCGTLLRARLRPKPWVFQFNPAIYRWFDRIKENRVIEQWLTSRHVRDIREGDKVVVWASGWKAGIYALGEIVAGPRKSPLNPEQEKYWIDRGDVSKFQEKYSVTIKYFKVLIERPLLEDECKRDPVLSDMTVLKQLQGTNFPLTREQWNRILELVSQKQLST